MKIEQVMRPEEAELVNRVHVYLVQDIPEEQPYSDDAYVASVVLVLRKDDAVRAGDRYKMPDELKPCPFCGKTDTLVWADARDMEDCDIFYECEAYECRRGCIVCAVSRGGCGASSGYMPTEEKAAAAWNRRAKMGDEAAEILQSLSNGELPPLRWEDF